MISCNRKALRVTHPCYGIRHWSLAASRPRIATSTRHAGVLIRAISRNERAHKRPCQFVLIRKNRVDFVSGVVAARSSLFRRRGVPSEGQEIARACDESVTLVGCRRCNDFAGEQVFKLLLAGFFRGAGGIFVVRVLREVEVFVFIPTDAVCRQRCVVSSGSVLGRTPFWTHTTMQRNCETLHSVQRLTIQHSHCRCGDPQKASLCHHQRIKVF
jgi:hypothetical protein